MTPKYLGACFCKGKS